MKIQKIKIENLKSIDQIEVDFKGCSAIVTGGNNKGKSTLLKSLIERFRSKKPEVIVKSGKHKGFYEMELTDGSKIRWDFKETGSEKFQFITKEGFKTQNGVLSSLSERYFGKEFNIDKFLNSGHLEQVKALQKIAGIDFDEIDQEIEKWYDERRKKKILLDNFKIEKPEALELINLERLKSEMKEAEKTNQEKELAWEKACEEERHKIDAHNVQQEQKAKKIFECEKELSLLQQINSLSEYVDLSMAKYYVENLPQPEILKKFTYPEKPQLVDVNKMGMKYKEAEMEQKHYKKQLSEYKASLESIDVLQKEISTAEKNLSELREKKFEIIKNSSIPNEFQIEQGKVFYNGFSISDTQLSTSAKYIAALKLGALTLGELKSIHFDASFLDRNSLREIEEWAEEEGLQLLIERPDFNAGEITYDLIS